MDTWVALAVPVETTFAYLADPVRLADWLPTVSAVRTTGGGIGIGCAFRLRLRLDGHEVPATGELVAYEPPRALAYRFLSGSWSWVLHLTCTSYDGDTRLRLQHFDDQRCQAIPIGVDLSALRRAVQRQLPVPPVGRIPATSEEERS